MCTILTPICCRRAATRFASYFRATYRSPAAGRVVRRRQFGPSRFACRTVRLTPHFKFRDGVRIKFVSDLGGARLPKADALIATSFHTAELLRHAPVTRGRKFYIVYDYEYWRTAEPATRKRIERTYSADFQIISTSGAVDGMLRQCGAIPRARIPCGIDFDVFGRDIPSALRTPLTVGFPGAQ